tara:strand:- start:443 stop:682 length:240 start_codon:yes stop_codon:yes gene_type:complete
MIQKIEFTNEVDASGLNCPLPILKAKKMLNNMLSGEILRVLSTDLSSVRDFEAFSRQTGNQLLSHEKNKEKFIFYIRRR